MNRNKVFTVLLTILFSTLIFADETQDRTLRLKIGNPQLKNKTLEIVPGKIFSAQSGQVVSFGEMIKEMKDSRFIYVGETHDSLPMHDIQFKIAEALYQQTHKLAIGLEMFDVDWQKPLNKWSLGLLTQEEFLDDSQWYVNWNFNFNYYEKIFTLAKENKVPMYALNAPRKIIRKIRILGWESLTNEEKKYVPKPDLSNKDHKQLMQTIFEDMEMPEAMKGHGDIMYKAIYRAQSAWDEVMAANTLRAANIEERRILVLAGSGHLIYNLGINRRAFEKHPSPYKTVISGVVPSGQDNIVGSRSIGDYIWGLKEEDRPAYPSVGITLKKFDGLDNPVIEKEPILGAAKGKNFKQGDVVLSVDGKRFFSINKLRTYLSKFSWGDEVTFKLLREAKEIEVKLKFAQIRE